MAVAERVVDTRASVGGLARYLSAAVLVRTADGGAAVGLVLLALDPGLRLRNGAVIGGALAAALSAPHLLGPWVGRLLSRARDGRRTLAAAYVIYAGALAAGALAVGRLPAFVALAVVVVAGCCGPLLTGGLSSRLAGIAGPSEHSQRRAHGWDAVTYGLGGTAGPAVVAGLGALSGPLAALLGLSAAAAAAALLTLTLPRGDSGQSAAEKAPGIWRSVGLLVSYGPLRRVTTMTMWTAIGIGAMPVIAATLGPQLTGRHGSGATLTLALGLGSLAGSGFVTIFPLRGEPEVLAFRNVLGMAVVGALCALAPDYPLALAGFALMGVASAVFLTATLAARSAYTSPEARTQVFVTTVGLKVTLGAVGSVAAGAMAGLGDTLLLLFTAALAGCAALMVLTDRFLTRPRR